MASGRGYLLPMEVNLYLAYSSPLGNTAIYSRACQYRVSVNTVMKPRTPDIDDVTDGAMDAIARVLLKNDIEFVHLYDKVRPAVRKLVASVIEEKSNARR